jgi:hypothetical protein
MIIKKIQKKYQIMTSMGIKPNILFEKYNCPNGAQSHALLSSAIKSRKKQYIIPKRKDPARSRLMFFGFLTKRYIEGTIKYKVVETRKRTLNKRMIATETSIQAIRTVRSIFKSFFMQSI